jgi:hypothetical protein
MWEASKNKKKNEEVSLMKKGSRKRKLNEVFERESIKDITFEEEDEEDLEDGI